MSNSARTVFVFGWYLVGLGVVLVTVPNVILQMSFLPPTDEVWVRVVGMLVLCLAYYYINAARAGLRPMLEWTVHVRLTIVAWFTAFVVLGFAEWPLILFGATDFAAALWTRAALRAEARG